MAGIQSGRGLAGLVSFLLTITVGVQVSAVGDARAQGLTLFASAPPTGEALYRSRCGGCHALDRNRYGPSHHALLGRVAGTQPGYRYTPALSGAGIVWTEAALDRWLTNPRKLVPGTRMDASVRDPLQRRMIIDYLARGSKPGGAKP